MTAINFGYVCVLAFMGVVMLVELIQEAQWPQN